MSLNLIQLQNAFLRSLRLQISSMKRRPNKPVTRQGDFEKRTIFNGAEKNRQKDLEYIVGMVMTTSVPFYHS